MENRGREGTTGEESGGSIPGGQEGEQSEAYRLPGGVSMKTGVVDFKCVFPIL